MLKLGEGMNRWAETIKVALGEVLQMMSALARGDLSIRITGDYEADLLQLKTDTNATADKLAAIVGQTVDGIGAIKAATAQLASGSSDLSSPHRRAGGQPRRDGRGDPSALGHDQAERRECPAGQSAGRDARNAAERGGNVAAQRHHRHGADRSFLRAHFRDRRPDRGDRLPDQSCWRSTRP